MIKIPKNLYQIKKVKWNCRNIKIKCNRI